MRIRAFITETDPVRRILSNIGEPVDPPPTPGMEEVEPRLEQRPRISPARPGATLSCSPWVPAQTVPGLGVRCSTAAHPPDWDDPPVDALPDWEALAQPSPEYVFDQEVP
jgi:hypothetical protein